MNKTDKILVIGYGSIGQRHCRNLLSLGYKNICVYDPFIPKADESPVSRIEVLEKIKDYSIFKTAIICTPGDSHISYALRCARAGCHVFIEKPLSSNRRGIKKLAEICRQNNVINMVACNMRFHPSILFIKGYLDRKKLGKVHFYNLQTGYYLPYWRPQIDYRRTYAVDKATGGGIMLDGGIHNIDLLFWLNDFAPVIRNQRLYSRLSSLEIKTEDCFSSIFQFSNKTMAAVNGDYLQQEYSWNIKIVGELGNLEWNFSDNLVRCGTKGGKETIFNPGRYDPNDMYLSEMKYFLDCVEKKKDTFNSVALAANILKYSL